MNKYEANIEINGGLYINEAKFEWVDKIIVKDKTIEIFNEGKKIGQIKRNKIKTFVERNYALSITTDLIENLPFDLRIEGDF